MFYCSFCTCSYTKINYLISHLSHFHKYSFNRFICKQENCYREFQNLSKFKEHLLNKHAFKVHINVSPQNQLTIKNKDLNSNEESRQDASKNINYHYEICDMQNYQDCDNNKNFLVNDIKNQLAESASSFIATFYSDKNIHDRHIQKIINTTKNFIENKILLSLKNNIYNVLKKSNIDNKIKLQIEEMFQVYKNSFYGSFIEPEYYVIGTRNVHKRHKGLVSLTPVKATSQFVSIKKTLNSLFHISGFLTTILIYMHILLEESNIIYNVVQGKTYKRLLAQFPANS
ncbi:hypothetical protein PUN28_008199 [Cardiocondyla obscurior]|uniref:C2H2-type domain-containing protein n=1 Tax=Cardiocondyla obscurior TaxID=286306 RepID=A0AAW2FWL4_9HYME